MKFLFEERISNGKVVKVFRNDYQIENKNNQVIKHNIEMWHFYFYLKLYELRADFALHFYAKILVYPKTI